MGNNNRYRIKFGTTISTGIPFGANRICSNGVIIFWSTYYTDEIATFHRIDNYDIHINAAECLSIKTSGINVTPNLNISGTTTWNITINNGTLNISLNMSGYRNIRSSLVVLEDESVSGKNQSDWERAR